VFLSKIRKTWRGNTGDEIKKGKTMRRVVAGKATHQWVAPLQLASPCKSISFVQVLQKPSAYIKSTY
jgi:hypothetical protein